MLGLFAPIVALGCFFTNIGEWIVRDEETLASVLHSNLFIFKWLRHD